NQQGHAASQEHASSSCPETFQGVFFSSETATSVVRRRRQTREPKRKRMKSSSLCSIVLFRTDGARHEHTTRGTFGARDVRRQSRRPVLFSSGHDFRTHQDSEVTMLKLALIFFLIGLAAALLGFTGIAGASFAIAKLFAVLFGILFLIFLILGFSAASRIAA